MKGVKSGWSSKDVSALKAMMRSGMVPTQIAVATGRTVEDCRQRFAQVLRRRAQQRILDSQRVRKIEHGGRPPIRPPYVPSEDVAVVYVTAPPHESTHLPPPPRVPVSVARIRWTERQDAQQPRLRS